MSNMECKNKKCVNNYKSNCKGRGTVELSGCNKYKELLPLWEFQDKWKGLKNGLDYGIEFERDGFYFGWFYDDFYIKAAKWSIKGEILFNNSQYDLVPKEPEFYDGWIDGEGILYTCGIKKGWKPVKLQVVKDDRTNLKGETI